MIKQFHFSPIIQVTNNPKFDWVDSFKKGDYAGVVNFLSAHMNSGLGSPSICYALAASYYRLGKFAETEQAANTFVSRYPVNMAIDKFYSPTCAMAGRACRKQKMPDKAFCWFSCALNREPWNQKYRWYIVRSYIENNNFYWAMNVATEMVNASPSPISYYALGRVFEHKNYFDAAIEHYKLALGTEMIVNRKAQARITKIQLTSLENDINN
jgi:tetratricopeptide (TPR) repeat protein